MKLLLQPESASYAAQFGDEVVRQQLDGGAGRYRKDIQHSSTMLDCTWILDRGEYDYFMAFYRTITERGALPFTIDLVVDDHQLVEREVHLASPPRLESQNGLSHVVRAVLEISPVVDPEQADDDQDVVDAYNTAHGYSP